MGAMAAVPFKASQLRAGKTPGAFAHAKSAAGRQVQVCTST